MPAVRDDHADRRSLVPPRAAGSLWASAAWTGAGTAVVGAVVAIAMVAVLWLPAAGTAGNAGSAIRAGLLTFLAGVHGGITVDGLAADFVPLGLTLLVAALAWRAGTGLADAAHELGERAPSRLLGAAAFQAAAFAVMCAVAGHLATLGTSSVPPFGVTVAAFVLFLLVAGAALVRWSPLRDDLADVLPSWTGRVVRAAVAVVAVYLVGGALLAAGALAVHHSTVESLSAQVGGGLSGVPVLVLGALAAPNATLAGATYLAGPGFAMGDGNRISLWTGGHGVVPAFPILGGLPSGPAGAVTWVLAALTLCAAGLCAATLIRAGGSAWSVRLVDLARTSAVVAVLWAVLAWQGGGAIGSGRLSAVGASPWQAGMAFAAITLVGGAAGLVAISAGVWLRGRKLDAAPIAAFAARADAASEAFTQALESTHSRVRVDDDGAGVLRGTLRSVAAAVTRTEEERTVTPSAPPETDSEITAPIARVVEPDAGAQDKRAG